MMLCDERKNRRFIKKLLRRVDIKEEMEYNVLIVPKGNYYD